MRFDVLTLFPGMFTGPLSESILKRAIQAGRISVVLHDIRAYATDRHRTTDDAPYGGGAGMVMKPEPLAACIRAVLAMTDNDTGESAPKPPVILMTPDGEPFTQRIAAELATCPRLVLVCGRYEGVDERVRAALIDRELSIGDYVLTGGELAAMVVIDAVARLVPGVIDAESAAEESFSDGLLEYPQYTRPAVWEGREVPPVLVSGHHGEVAQWRRRERLRRTLERRPDLLARAVLTDADRAYLRTLGWRVPVAGGADDSTRIATDRDGADDSTRIATDRDG
ncbi:tRNA (guanosine(37)-N1)-methyltransferase TrmD [Roseiflexus castenholzii]|jgi:tRNA (guanine37-N1)-methyltransferase|nr:tRNA (guanosine(37)-N1)-methyltransferase TrmD [Roseiflexus castenholzii]